MRILLVHNHYKKAGGEDEVVHTERSLLRSRGHEVMEYTDHNDAVDGMTKLQVAQQIIWSRVSVKRIIGEAKRFRPDVVHFHNTFVRISPAPIRACSRAGFPVVQTLHNYRLLCPAATFYREGHLCEQCLGKTFAWPSILYGCWHSSRLQTFPVALMQLTHRLLKTWNRYVDVTIVLSQFSRCKFVEGGLPGDKIIVKPNCVDDPGLAPDAAASGNGGEYAIFLGRLSPEKGVRTLLEAWRRVEHFSLKIVGDGILRSELERATMEGAFRNVEIVGYKTRLEVLHLLKNAAFLIFPSEWYEACSRTVLESLACGRPIIASDFGSMREFTKHGHTGLLFKAGDADDLAAKIIWALEHRAAMAEMGRNARREYELKYTPERNYEMLMEIYQQAIENHRRRSQDRRA